jgi:hypothetical protein
MIGGTSGSETKLCQPSGFQLLDHLPPVFAQVSEF